MGVIHTNAGESVGDLDVASSNQVVAETAKERQVRWGEFLTGIKTVDIVCGLARVHPIVGLCFSKASDEAYHITQLIQIDKVSS